MRILAFLIGAMILVGVGAKRAEACGSAGGGGLAAVYVGAYVVGGAYVSGTLAFGIADIADDDHSIAYGVLETTVNTGFAVATTAIAVNEANQDRNWAIPGLLTALHVGLAAHGIYAIAKRANKHEPRPAVSPHQYDGPPGYWDIGPVSASLAPAPIRDGAGIGLAGTF